MPYRSDSKKQQKKEPTKHDLNVWEERVQSVIRTQQRPDFHKDDDGKWRTESGTVLGYKQTIHRCDCGWEEAVDLEPGNEPQLVSIQWPQCDRCSSRY